MNVKVHILEELSFEFISPSFEEIFESFHTQACVSLLFFAALAAYYTNCKSER